MRKIANAIGSARSICGALYREINIERLVLRRRPLSPGPLQVSGQRDGRNFNELAACDGVSRYAVVLCAAVAFSRRINGLLHHEAAFLDACDALVDAQGSKTMRAVVTPNVEYDRHNAAGAHTVDRNHGEPSSVNLARRTPAGVAAGDNVGSVDARV